MTTYSKADLAAKALRMPGLYAPDEDITADDQAEAEEMVEALVETLAEMDINIPNGSASMVPSSWYLPLASYCGMFILQNYGGPAPTDAQITGAEKMLRRMSAKKATGQVADAVYY